MGITAEGTGLRQRVLPVAETTGLRGGRRLGETVREPLNWIDDEAAIGWSRASVDGLIVRAKAVPCALVASPLGLPVAASTPVSDLAGTAEWSSGRSPGCSAFAALASATSGAPTCSTGYRTWPVR